MEEQVTVERNWERFYSCKLKLEMVLQERSQKSQERSEGFVCRRKSLSTSAIPTEKNPRHGKWEETINHNIKDMLIKVNTNENTDDKVSFKDMM